MEQTKDPLKVIIIDDTEDIHSNIKILFQNQVTHSVLDELSEEIFGNTKKKTSNKSNFDITLDSAFQGKDGYEMIKDAYENGSPYSVAVVDMRMPPGWDRLMTIEKIREVDQDIEIIISSAYSDYSWQDIADRLGVSNKYLFLSKPFEVAEMKQMIIALGQKWLLDRNNKKHIEELEDARRAIESAIQAKEDFLGVMSHELRTPLNIIIMTIEDFLEAESDPDNARILRNSEDSAKYLARLIDNIMYFIHLDSHNFQHDNSDVNVEDFLNEILESYEDQVSQGNIKVSKSLDPDLPDLYIDKKPLQVAILQVIENAFKFTDKGNINISTKLVQGNGSNCISLVIEDSGIGMTKQELDQAFELFYQGEPSNHHSRAGTGVGLSLCRKALSSLKGTITCVSEEGKGSKFTINIPIDMPISKKAPEKLIS